MHLFESLFVCFFVCFFVAFFDLIHVSYLLNCNTLAQMLFPMLSLLECFLVEVTIQSRVEKGKKHD